MSCPCPQHSPDRPQPDQVGPAVVATIDGNPVLGHRLLTNGQVLCQICFEYCWPCQLDEPEPGVRSDICVPCAETEKNTFRCPRCLKVTVNADHKLYGFCPACDAHTGGINPDEVCAIHYRHEPSLPGDYKACYECKHVWRTEQEFIDDVLTDYREHAAAALRYDGYTYPAEYEGDPLQQYFCPLCAHDF